MKLKEEIQNVLSKTYRNSPLTLNEIRLLVSNPIERVSKVELVESDGLKYVVHFENMANKSVGDIL